MTSNADRQRVLEQIRTIRASLEPFENRLAKASTKIERDAAKTNLDQRNNLIRNLERSIGI